MFIPELWDIIINFMDYEDVRKILYTLTLLATRANIHFDAKSILKFYALRQVNKNPVINYFNSIYKHIDTIDTPLKYMNVCDKIYKYYCSYDCTIEKVNDAKTYILAFMRFIENNKHKQKIKHIFLRTITINYYENLPDKNTLPIPINLLEIMA
jgi:hypothetical protein